MRRSAWAWTAGLLMLPCLTVLLLLRLFDCVQCAGVYRKFQDTPAPGVNPAPTGCPDCRDAGRVSLLTRWRKKPIDARLRTLIQSPVDYAKARPAPDAALHSLLEDQGASARYGKSSELKVEQARFVVAEERDLVLVVGRQWRTGGSTIPSYGSAQQAWIFDLQGKLLDSLAVADSKKSARCSLGIVTDPFPFSAEKDAVLGISVLDHSADREFDISRHTIYARDLSGVRSWQQGVGEIPPAQWIQDGKAYFKIAGGKFVRIPPAP